MKKHVFCTKNQRCACAGMKGEFRTPDCQNLSKLLWPKQTTATTKNGYLLRETTTKDIVGQFCLVQQFKNSVSSYVFLVHCVVFPIQLVSEASLLMKFFAAFSCSSRFYTKFLLKCVMFIMFLWFVVFSMLRCGHPVMHGGFISLGVISRVARIQALVLECCLFSISERN